MTEGLRNHRREFEFLKRRVGGLARGRFADDQEDVAMDAWVRLDRWARKGNEAHNFEAVMMSIAERAWLDFLDRKESRLKRRGGETPIDNEPIAALVEKRGVDPADLALVRFAVSEWFRANKPRCAALAKHYFAGRSWKEVSNLEATVEGPAEKPNSIAQRWHRCQHAFISAARADHGRLAQLLSDFEGVVT